MMTWSYHQIIHFNPFFEGLQLYIQAVSAEKKHVTQQLNKNKYIKKLREHLNVLDFNERNIRAKTLDLYTFINVVRTK